MCVGGCMYVCWRVYVCVWEGGRGWNYMGRMEVFPPNVKMGQGGG